MRMIFGAACVLLILLALCACAPDVPRCQIRRAADQAAGGINAKTSQQPLARFTLLHDFIRKDLALIVVEDHAFGAVLVQRDAAADEGVAFFATKDGL